MCECVHMCVSKWFSHGNPCNVEIEVDRLQSLGSSPNFTDSSVGKESACSVGYLGWEDPLEKGTATHSSILAWRISWTVQSMGSQRVEHD